MDIKRSSKIPLIMLMMISLAGCASLGGVVTPTWPIPEGIKIVEVNGYPMAYQEAGSGTPLLLLHSHPADYRSWDTQIPEFSKSYRTIAVALRHYYPEKWDGVGTDFTIAQHASDIIAMIKKLNLGKVHLLGNSRGGTIAVTVATLQPEVIRSLILDEPNVIPLIRDTPEGQKWMTDQKAIGEKIRASLAAGGREKAAQDFMASFGVAWEKVPPRIQGMIIDNIGVCTESGDRGKFSCADIQKFNFPILLIAGEKSPKLYGQMLDALRRCKSDIPAPITVKGVHPNMHRQDTAAFNKAVLEFLSKH